MNFRYTAPATGPIVVTTSIANTTGDSYPPNDTATVSTEIGTTDVQTSVSVPATASAGSTVSGSFQFANFSSDTASDVSYTATIGSPGSCPSGVTFVTLPSGVTLNNYDTSTCAATFNGLPTDLASGQSFNFGFSYTAPSTGVIPVNTTINATGDANSANNAASGLTTVPQAPKLGLAKTDGTTTVNAGGTTSYTLTVSNTGNIATSGTITVVDVLPSGMTINDGAVTLSGAQLWQLELHSGERRDYVHEFDGHSGRRHECVRLHGERERECDGRADEQDGGGWRRRSTDEPADVHLGGQLFCGGHANAGVRH